MSAMRYELIHAANNRAYATNIHNDIHKLYEFTKQTVLADKSLTEGGCSEIYTADWINGGYEEWDSKEQQLERFGEHEVILKRLENVENANQRWFEEVCNLNVIK